MIEKRIKWRVIVKMSFDRDKGLRSELEAFLEAAQIQLRRNKATATWEGNDVDAATAALELGKMMKCLSEYLAARPNSRQQLDHLWIYIDRK